MRRIVVIQLGRNSGQLWPWPLRGPDATALILGPVGDQEEEVYLPCPSSPQRLLYQLFTHGVGHGLQRHPAQ